MFDLALTNCRAFIKDSLIETNIFISNEKIALISKKDFNAAEKINCKNLIVLPGLIDAHVHLREPGFTEKEDFVSGSKAALAAGITSVIDMPNNKEPIISFKLLKEKFSLAEKKMLVNFALNFGAANNNLKEAEKALKEEGVPGIKIFLGQSTGAMIVEENLKDFFDLSAKTNKTLFLHAEDEKTIKENEEKARKQQLSNPIIHSLIRTVEAEEIAVRKALELQAETNAKIHFCHISSKNALNLILKAKTEKITFETAPHYLFLTEKALDKQGNFCKVNPSIKSKQHQLALWKALKENKIDLIASDHAPHLIEEKNKDYWNAPSGMPGLETISLLLLNAVNKKLLTLNQFVSLLSFNPAKIFNFKNKGLIAENFDADLTLIDLKKEIKIKNELLFTKCKWSAFNGLKLKGAIIKTIVNGTLKFDEGNILNEKIKGKRLKC